MKITGENIDMKRGDSVVILVGLIAEDDETEIPITDGDVVYMTAKALDGSDQVVISKMVNKHFVNGLAPIHLKNIDTRDLVPASYEYDIRVARQGTAPKTVVPEDPATHPTLTIHREVTTL